MYWCPCTSYYLAAVPYARTVQDELAKLTQQFDDRNDEYGRLYHYCEEVLGEKAEVEEAAAGARQQLEALGAEAAELRRQVETLQADVADKEAKVRGGWKRGGAGLWWRLGCPRRAGLKGRSAGSPLGLCPEAAAASAHGRLSRRRCLPAIGLHWSPCPCGECAQARTHSLASPAPDGPTPPPSVLKPSTPTLTPSLPSSPRWQTCSTVWRSSTRRWRRSRLRATRRSRRRRTWR